MITAGAFRASIAAAPADDLPRLVFADWLEEHGELEQAAVLRLPRHPLWLRVWREGFAPVLPLAHLKALEAGLVADDPDLLQGVTTIPPPMSCVLDWPIEGTCCIGYGGWKSGEHKTVGEVEAFFSVACFEADQRLGEPAACRYFLNWWDDTPRDETRRLLLGLVREALRERTP
jgi:uncharacterized protein (TIGR02996 family)